jgi:hypothetical protein
MRKPLLIYVVLLFYQCRKGGRGRGQKKVKRRELKGEGNEAGKREKENVEQEGVEGNK